MKASKEHCSKCGYDKCQAALDNHHITKKGERTGEIVILCANCHREKHYLKHEKHKEVLCALCGKSLIGVYMGKFEPELCTECFFVLKDEAWNLFDECDVFESMGVDCYWIMHNMVQALLQEKLAERKKCS